MTLDELKIYKKILILGYGIEGKSSERFLKKFHPDANVSIADQKNGNDYLDVQGDYDLVIKTPGIRKELITQKYTTATNIFLANAQGITIGVTGTKGKSTAVTLIHHILQKGGKESVLLGNIGNAMLDSLTDDLIHPHTNIVLELSSYQLEDAQYSPHIACIINIFHELHNHLSYEEYFSAKARIIAFQNNNDYFFYNDKQSELTTLAKNTPATSIPFLPRNEIRSIIEMMSKNHKLEHNIDVTAAAFTIGRYNGISDEEIVKAIYSTKPLPHRIEYLGKYSGIDFYDDSAANHPEAVMNALNMLDSVSTIILGGQDRDFHFEDVIRKLAEKNVQHIVLFPDIAQKIQSLISSLSEYTPNVVEVHSMNEAVTQAFAVTKENEVCLLSPGAPSYLMFKNFNERGEAFQECIKKYAQKTS